MGIETVAHTSSVFAALLAGLESKGNSKSRGKGFMLKSEIKAGTHYAFREKRVPDTPLQRVRIIEHVRANKWKAEWIEPNPGLVHYVESGHLIVRWKEHKAF